ncbi:helix-turn-helix domain-containing protein [Nocardia sp. NPDC101769]|uniref:helix-turn-helix domain-containing protein n=1 Tax=Nocardia sp. NPDC101769 TaxID=3364333 RepID=UPI003806C714
MATKRQSAADVRSERGLISLKKAAALVDVDRKTILHWIDAGLLQGYKLNGSMWRVNLHEVLALVHPVTISDTDGAA